MKISTEFTKKLLNKAYEYFIENAELYIEEYYDNYNPRKFYFEFDKNLNIAIYTTIFYESEYFNRDIEVEPLFLKAETVEQAWKNLEIYIKEAIEIAIKSKINSPHEGTYKEGDSDEDPTEYDEEDLNYMFPDESWNYVIRE